MVVEGQVAGGFVSGGENGENAGQSVGSPSQIEDFRRSLRVLICCIYFLRL